MRMPSAVCSCHRGFGTSQKLSLLLPTSLRRGANKTSSRLLRRIILILRGPCSRTWRNVHLWQVRRRRDTAAASFGNRSQENNAATNRPPMVMSLNHSNCSGDSARSCNNLRCNPMSVALSVALLGVLLNCAAFFVTCLLFHLRMLTLSLNGQTG